MGKGGNGETRNETRKEKKRIMEIVSTNVVASRSPNGDRLQRRPLVPITSWLEDKKQQAMEGTTSTTPKEEKKTTSKTTTAEDNKKQQLTEQPNNKEKQQTTNVKLKKNNIKT